MSDRFNGSFRIEPEMLKFAAETGVEQDQLARFRRMVVYVALMGATAAMKSSDHRMSPITPAAEATLDFLLDLFAVHPEWAAAMIRGRADILASDDAEFEVLDVVTRLAPVVQESL